MLLAQRTHGAHRPDDLGRSEGAVQVAGRFCRRRTGPLNPTAAPRPLGDLLRDAIELVAASDRELKEVYVLTDRTQPALLESMQDLSRYVAAEGNFQVVVDLQNDRRNVPDWLLNQRTLFVGSGSVEAYVDFGTLTEGAIVQSADGKSVEIRLPAPQLAETNLDLEKSYVFAEERGLLNRVGDLIGGDPNRQQEVYRLAEEELVAAHEASRTRADLATEPRAIKAVNDALQPVISARVQQYLVDYKPIYSYFLVKHPHPGIQPQHTVGDGGLADAPPRLDLVV